MRIDLLVTNNAYDTATYFSEEFAKALIRQGASVRTFWIGEGNFYKAFYEITNDPPDLTCSFSDVTLGEGNLLCDAWKIPHLSFLVDHAIYFLHHLKSTYSLISCIDAEDLDLLKKLKFENPLFLPHAAPKELFEEKEEEKIYDVVFMGSCIDCEAIEKKWKKQFSQKKYEQLLANAEKILVSENYSCLQALSEMEVVEGLPKLHHELESYVRGKDRIYLVNALQGFGVHIWGKGPWKKYAPAAHLHKQISFPKATQVMKRSKIVLNSVPSLKFGGHERIFHAFGAHALPLTSRTAFITEHFEEGKSIVAYKYGEELTDRVRMYLDNRNAVVQAGREIVLRDHTWDVRAKELLMQLKYRASTSTKARASD